MPEAVDCKAIIIIFYELCDNTTTIWHCAYYVVAREAAIPTVCEH